jgi:hypothetical protein
MAGSQWPSRFPDGLVEPRLLVPSKTNIGSATYTNASFGALTTGNINVDTLEIGINFLFH